MSAVAFTMPTEWNPMNRDWVQIVANIGLIAGLILVGLQLKQNSDLLKTQLLYEESGRFISSEQAMYGEEPARTWAKSIETPRDLTLEEIRIIDAYLYTMVEHWRATQMLAEEGLLDERDEWQFRVKNEAQYFFGNEYARAWWSVYREEIVISSPELITIVDDVIAADPDGTLRYLMQPMKKIGAANGAQ